MNKFMVTTAIDYVNGAPHIGHAFEKILTDVLYRHFKQRCDRTFFLTGTDEHGIKIQKTAAQMGITPKELCDENAQKFMEEVKKAIPDVEVTYCDPLSLSVSCHIGPGALAVALYRELV